jgi:hypothetical protein
MKMTLRFVHPIFCWAVLLFFGLDSIQRQLFLPIAVVAIGLGGMSQIYWRTHFSGLKQYEKGDLISFALGLLAAIAFPILVGWHYLYHY